MGPAPVRGRPDGGRTWAEGFGDPKAVARMVSSIQTFGSYAANFHPHIYSLITDGVVTPEGEFLPLPRWTPRTLEEVFRRLVLARLVEAERLSEEFRDTLLSWVHSGFSVYGEQVVLANEPERLKRLARYVVRAPMPFSAVEVTDGERVRVVTPPNPRTGEREVVLDPLEFLHTLGRQVPDPRQHLVRYYGVYANRSRKLWQDRWRGPPWGTENTGSGTGQAGGGPEPDHARSGDRPASRGGS